MFPQRRCPGCKKPLGPMSEICGECAQAEAMQRAEEDRILMEYVADGLERLGLYLTAWAAFRDHERHHPPV